MQTIVLRKTSFYKALMQISHNQSADNIKDCTGGTSVFQMLAKAHQSNKCAPNASQGHTRAARLFKIKDQGYTAKSKCVPNYN